MGTEGLCYLRILSSKGLLPSITFLTGKQICIWGLGEDLTAHSFCPRGAGSEEGGETTGRVVTSSFAVSFQTARACMEPQKKSLSLT